MTLVAGVDSSTQSTKALVVDAATGQVVASGQAPHTVTSGAGRESDPRQWWDALCAALDQCGDAAREASAVSVGGQQHGLVTLDEHGEPVRPALLWNDVRSAPQARRLIDERWHEKLTLDSIARACGINRAKLTRGFRSMFATTVADAIADMRLRGAGEMLRSTDLPVSSIGYRCGYLNNASFTRAFSRHYGVAPTQYRAHRLAA